MLEQTATPPTADSDLDDILRSLADSLPALDGLIFPQQLSAAIQAFSDRIVSAELLREVRAFTPEASEKVERFIADVTALRNAAEAKMPEAIRQMGEKRAQSGRLQGRTVSVGKQMGSVRLWVEPIATADVPGNGTPPPRRAESSGRPRAGHSSSAVASRVGTSYFQPNANARS